jgi:hypothetical protein
MLAPDVSPRVSICTNEQLTLWRSGMLRREVIIIFEAATIAEHRCVHRGPASYKDYREFGMQLDGLPRNYLFALSCRLCAKTLWTLLSLAPRTIPSQPSSFPNL